MAALTRYANSELLELPDCAGLQENGKCRWLDLPACAGGDCTYRRQRDSRAQAEQRLRGLDEATQARIARKYYGGSRPWLGSCATRRREDV